MRNIPAALLAQFEVVLRDRAVPNNAHGSYKKWLRYYLDFYRKYQFSESKRESLAQFLLKLEEKRQTQAQQQEAAHAITLYSELIDSLGSHDEFGSPQKVISPGRFPTNLPPRSIAQPGCWPRVDRLSGGSSQGTACSAPPTHSDP